MRAAFAAGGPGLPQSTLSAGVTAATSPVELQPHLQLADAALYAAKRGGRDRTGIDSRLPPEPAATG
jgi:PleD family two-component response regulator